MGPVTASRPVLPRGSSLPVLVQHAGAITRQGPARRARADRVAGGRDEDVDHFGRADPVDDPKCRSFRTTVSETAFGRNSPAETQRLSDARLRPASSPASARYAIGAVKRQVTPCRLDGGEHGRRRRRLDRHGRPPESQRKYQQRPESESETQGRAAGVDVPRRSSRADACPPRRPWRARRGGNARRPSAGRSCRT